MTTKIQANPRNGLVEMAAAQGFGRRFIEIDSGRVYDEGGKFLFAMASGDKGDEVQLADYVATYDAECISANTGRPVALRDPSFKTAENPNGERIIHCRHATESDGMRLMAAPQGDLGPADVHIDRGLPGYAAGYTLADGVADIAAPPFLVPNQSDKYWTWNEINAFGLVQPIITAAGGSPPEVSAALSTDSFKVVPYALGGFVPSELQANADAPLNVMQKISRVVMDKLKLAREIRVATLLETTANWNSDLVDTVAAGSKWNNGASADPIADLHTRLEHSYMDPTDNVLSELLFHWFVRSPAVQKYFYAKDGTPNLPSPEQVQAMFGLPKFTVAKIKYLPTPSSAITYVWGNHSVLLRTTAALATQQDVATARTFRWTGGPTSDGTAVGGWLVRTFYDQKRGPRGGTAIVVSHYDAEVITSKNVGGLIFNAYQ